MSPAFVDDGSIAMAWLFHTKPTPKTTAAELIGNCSGRR